MSTVEFHTDVAEPVAFACRLLRKAYRQGARVAVVAPQVSLRALDNALWTFDERDFVPHVVLPPLQGVGPMGRSELVQRSPIWLMSEVNTQGASGGPAVLVNLGVELVEPPDAIDALNHFERIIEIVSRDVDEAAEARQRWRRYRQWGWTVKHHNAASTG